MEKDSTKKPLGALIIASAKEEGAGGDDGGELSAAEDAVAAAQAGDAEGFASAMKSFVRICMRRYGKPPAYDEG